MSIKDFFKFGKKNKNINTKEQKQRAYQASKSWGMANNWGKNVTSSDYDINEALLTLKGRSRDLDENNSYYHKMVGLFVNNIIGKDGFRLQSNAKRGDLGDTPVLDTELNTEMLKLFTRWTKKRNCDITEQSSFADICSIVVSSLVIDGEAIVRIVRSEVTDFDLGFKLQVLDSTQLSMQTFFNAETQNVVKMGIEINDFGKPLAYFIAKPGVNTALIDYNFNTANYERVEAKDILHIFVKEKAEQKRGVPWGHSLMVTLQDLEDFDVAAINAAKIGASSGVYLTRQPGASVNGVADYKGPDGDMFGEIGVGQIRILPPGVDFKTFNANYPSDSYGQFTKRQLQKAAAGAGLSQVFFANDTENLNYSVARTILVEERDKYQKLQKFLIENFVAEVYEDFLMHLLINEKIVVKGRILLTDEYDKLLDYKFIPRSWVWIDPLKEIQAVLLEYKSGLKPLSQILNEKGLDLREVLEAYKNDTEIMKQTLGDDYEKYTSMFFGAAEIATKDAPDSIDMETGGMDEEKPNPNNAKANKN